MFKDILEFIFMTSIVAMMTFGILYSLKLILLITCQKLL